MSGGEIALLGLIGGAIFVVLFFAGGRGAARLNGWTPLAERHPYDGGCDGPTLLCMGSMGNVVTSREPWMIRVGPMPEGLYLATELPSTAAFPPMRVPWSEVQIRNRHFAAFNLITVYLGEERHELLLRGFPGNAIDKEFEAQLLAFYDAGKKSTSQP